VSLDSCDATVTVTPFRKNCFYLYSRSCRYCRPKESYSETTRPCRERGSLVGCLAIQGIRIVAQEELQEYLLTIDFLDRNQVVKLSDRTRVADVELAKYEILLMQVPGAISL